jgi:phosphoglycolate phosphatase
MIETALAEAGAAPELSLMIGDTSYDMAMAKAAGVTAVGAAWGYHDRQELLAAGADYVAAHPSEIADLMKAFA